MPLRNVALSVLCLAAVVIAACVAAAAMQSSRAEGAPSSASRGYAYPLKVSRNRRYLVDQRNTPFMIVGDSPQAMIGNLGLQDAAAFIANRKRAGFNSLLVDLLCATYTGCRADGTTYDGIKPFTKPGDLSTPNPAYFARADAMIRLAANAGMVVFLDPIETGGWLGVLKANGVAKDRAFGRFVGRRYKSFKNVVWWHGNDFQSWGKASDDEVALAVAQGIASVDRAHLQTVLLSYTLSSSLDDARWRPLIRLDAAYTYMPTYAEVLKEYNRPQFMPVFMGEAAYEFEHNTGSPGTPEILRRQEYWSMLSGATGQFYGNHYTWQFASGWKDHLDTPGSVQLGRLVKLFAGRPWYRLVPDQAHRVVTAGYGTFSSGGTVGSSNYVTTSATRDGTLAVSYLPDGGTVTVDTARLARHPQGRWYDPASGKYRSIPSSQLAKRARVKLTAPGKNADGDHDWVLVLTAKR